MDIQNLISKTELTEKLAELRSQIQQPEHAISDIIDADGNQYIDLVMEGGGMLGIALVGYSWALEEMGIRFFGVGGTSAGSINALLLAALDEPAKAKSPRLLNELANKNFYDFIDGGDDVRILIELALGSDKKFKKLRMAWKAMKVKSQLCSKYGLNKGDAFVKWLHGLLSGAGVDTNAATVSHCRMRIVPGVNSSSLQQMLQLKRGSSFRVWPNCIGPTRSWNLPPSLLVLPWRYRSFSNHYVLVMYQVIMKQEKTGVNWQVMQWTKTQPRKFPPRQCLSMAVPCPTSPSTLFIIATRYLRCLRLVSNCNMINAVNHLISCLCLDQAD